MLSARICLAAVGLAAFGLPLATAAPAATASTGTTVTLSGVFVEVHGDSRYADQTLYFLKSSGREYQLKTAGEPHFRSRAKVTAHGRLTGNVIDVTSGGSIAAAAAAPSPAPASVTGTQLALVINVIWAGASLTATAAQEDNFMFGSDSRTVASYYTDASYGQMTWTGTETPNYVITDPGSCDLSSLANQAESAATTGGYNTSAYRAVVINAPNLHCAAVGYGEIGGSHVWLQDGLWNLADGYARLVPTHEIGHSLGLYHSHGLECGAFTITSTCLSNSTANNEEYGNAWDVMGNNWPGDGSDAVTWFSAKQEMLLGWLSGSQINNVTTTGTYTLVPLEKSGTAGSQVLVLSTPSHTYYVEYRQPISQDAFLSAYPAATNSVHVSVSGSPGSDTGPFALDFTPGSAAGGYYDWYDAPLTMGGSFTDPENTFTLSPISQNGITATVNITITGTATSYPLLVTKSGSGSGTVTSNPSGISCGTTCGVSYSSGTSVTLTEMPAVGSTFAGWSGACSGTTTSCTVAMNSAQSVTASFTGSVVTTYQEGAATYNGTWLPSSCVCFSAGATKYALASAASASFTFTGTKVVFISERKSDRGSFQVYLDGVFKTTVSNYITTTAQNAVVVWSKGFTNRGTHTLKIVVIGTAGHPRVDVDAFKVTA